MSQIQHVTGADFEEKVADSATPTVVDFYASWCGPCRMLAPVLEELSGEFAGKVNVAKVDVDSEQELAMQFGVQSIPTLIFFKNGEAVDRVVGLASAQALRAKMTAITASNE